MNAELIKRHNALKMAANDLRARTQSVFVLTALLQDHQVLTAQLIAHADQLKNELETDQPAHSHAPAVPGQARTEAKPNRPQPASPRTPVPAPDEIF